MTDRCFRLDELDSILDLAPEDPRQRHLADCPLCRARLAAYKTFITERPPLTGSQPESAKAGLEAFVERMIRGGAEEKDKIDIWTRLREHRTLKRVFVPGLAAAAVAAVVLIAVLRPFPERDQQRQAPLRGLESPATGGPMISALPAVVRKGTVVFSWAPVPDCDRYQVQVFDSKLDEVARFEAASDTSLQIQASEIPAAAGSLFWRIVAFREGDEINHSRPFPLDIGKR